VHTCLVPSTTFACRAVGGRFVISPSRVDVAHVSLSAGAAYWLCCAELAVATEWEAAAGPAVQREAAAAAPAAAALFRISLCDVDVETLGEAGLGFDSQGSGFRVQGSGFRVQGSGFIVVHSSLFRVKGLGFRV